MKVRNPKVKFRDIPFEHEDEHRRSNNPQLTDPVGDALFDGMLSYCSCLFLAQWIHYFYKTDAARLKPSYWIRQPQRVWACAKEFRAWRKAK